MNNLCEKPMLYKWSVGFNCSIVNIINVAYIKICKHLIENNKADYIENNENIIKETKRKY